MVSSIPYAVRRARRNAYSITNRHRVALVSQPHFADSCEDMVELFAAKMAVQHGSRPGSHACFRQTLVPAGVTGGVHELPDGGAVPRHKGLDIPSAGFQPRFRG